MAILRRNEDRRMPVVVVWPSDRPAIAGQPPHDRDVPSLHCDEDRGKYTVGGALGDRPAATSQPLHHREIAILRRRMAAWSGLCPSLSGSVTDPPLLVKLL